MEWIGMDICLTDNHLTDFSFISLIWSESETSVKLHPKLKLTNILKFIQHYSFTTILLRIPVDFTALLCSIHSDALFVTVFWLNYLTLCEGLCLGLGLGLRKFLKSWSWTWSWNKSLGLDLSLGLVKKVLFTSLPKPSKNRCNSS